MSPAANRNAPGSSANAATPSTTRTPNNLIPVREALAGTGSGEGAPVGVATCAPQCWQNIEPDGTSCPHALQNIRGLLSRHRNKSSGKHSGDEIARML